MASEVFDGLKGLEDRPWCLTEMAYGWCAAILQDCQTRQSLEWFLLRSLEVGFRHLSSSSRKFRGITLTHTEHHRELVEIVFNSNDSEAIADLLRAFTMHMVNRPLEGTPLDICAGYLINLHDKITVPFSPRLRCLVVRSIEWLVYHGFNEVGTERFVEFLNSLHVDTEDVDDPNEWVSVLLEVMESSEGAQHLAIPSWELLVELKITRRIINATYNPCVTDYLLTSQQWDKLECWMGFVWMNLPVPDDMMEGIEDATASLFHQRPGAVQKLIEWIERYSINKYKEVPGSFQQICNEAQLVTFCTRLTRLSPEIRFCLQACHPTKGMRNLLVCRRPLSPHCREATNSGSCYP